MKYLKLIILFLCLPSFAQNIDLRWSDKIKTNGREIIVGGRDGRYYTRNNTKDNSIIFKTFDDKAVLKSEVDANFKLGKIEYEYFWSYFSDKNIQHFLTQHKRKEKTFFIYTSLTNKNFEPIGETLVLSEVNFKSLVNYGIIKSPDETKILVWLELKGKKKSKPNSIQYKVFDAQFKNVLIDKTIELQKSAEDMKVSNCLLDDYLNVFVNSVVTKPDDEQKKDEAESYVNTTVYSKQGEAKNIQYDFKNKTIDSFFLQLSNDNSLLAVGFLSPIIKGFLKSKKREMVSDEFFIVKNDCESLKELHNKVISVSSLYPDKVSKTSELVPYKVRSLFEQNDGNFSIVAEQYKSVYHSGYKGQGYFVYYYCDIAVINLDEKLNTKSLVKIPKYQEDAKNPSLISTNYKGKTYIVYEDKTKNDNVMTDTDIKKSTSNMFSRDTNKSLFLATIDAKGVLKKEILFSYENSTIRPIFTNSSVVNDGEILLNANDYIGILKIK